VGVVRAKGATLNGITVSEALKQLAVENAECAEIINWLTAYKPAPGPDENRVRGINQGRKRQGTVPCLDV